MRNMRPEQDLMRRRPAFKWAHTDGGHVATNIGAVFWLPNVYNTDTGFGNSKSWLSGGVNTFYSYYGVGLDRYVANR